MALFQIGVKSIGGIERVNARGQVGFKEGRSTLDHNLTLCTLNEHEVFVGRYLYSRFVDFEQSFNIVLRDKLWEQLQQLSISLHSQRVVKAMYTTIYASTRINGDTHDVIMYDVGVKQGCCLSPTLFSLYIDALETY